MGSNKEKKPKLIYKIYTKNEAKGLRATTLLSQSWKSDNLMGSNKEKYNIAIAILDKWSIWTYPISPFKAVKKYPKEIKLWLEIWNSLIFVGGVQ